MTNSVATSLIAVEKSRQSKEKKAFPAAKGEDAFRAGIALSRYPPLKHVHLLAHQDGIVSVAKEPD